MEDSQFSEREGISAEEMSFDELNVLGWNAFLEGNADLLSVAAQVARSRAEAFAAIDRTIGKSDIVTREYGKLALSLEHDLARLPERGGVL